MLGHKAGGASAEEISSLFRKSGRDFMQINDAPIMQ